MARSSESTSIGSADEHGLPVGIGERLQAFVGRGWVFDAVAEWLASERGSFLLTGPPGSGKSMIAARLVESVDCAYSHFCRARHTSSNPTTFVERLSTVLATRLPGYLEALEQRPTQSIDISSQVTAGTVESGGSVVGTSIAVHIHNLSPEAAFDEAVRKPLERLGDGGPLLVVVDGLDEALTAGSPSIVELMSYVVRSPPPRLRFVLTSRSGEVRVLDRLGPPSLDLLEDLPSGWSDVAEYAFQNLDRLPAASRHTLASRIARASGENFLYAFHVTGDLAGRQDSIGDLSEARLPQGLRGFYHQYLSREIARDRLGEEWRRQVRPVLSLLASARGDGLTVRQIARAVPKLAGQKLPAAHIVDALHVCGQFLVWPGDGAPAHIWHSSFRDFLTQDRHFGIFAEEANLALTESFVDQWTGRWDDCDEVYALAHLPGHLAEALRDTGDGALSRSMLALLTDLSFGRQKTAALGIDSFIADLREAVPLLPEPESRLGELLETVDRVAHELRLWDAAEAPGRFEQQLLLRAQQYDLDWLVEACTERLQAFGLPYLKTRWRASMESRAIERVMAGQQDRVESVVLTEDGTRAISASRDSTGRVWDLNTGQAVSIFQGGDAPLLCLSPCVGDAVVAGDESGGVWLWDLDALDVRRITSLDAPVRSVHLTGDGAFAVSVDRAGTIAVTEVDGGAEIHRLSCANQVGPVGWPTDDRRVLVGLASGRIEVWNYVEGRQEAVLEGQTDELTFIAVSQNGELAASASEFDDDIRIWSLTDYKPVRSLDDSSGQCFGMAFRHGTSLLVTAHINHGLRVWDLRTGACVQLPVLQVPMRRVVLSHDGRYAFTTSAVDDFLVRVWDLDRSELASVLYGHVLVVSAICVTNDGHRVVTGSYDKTVRVWDMDRLEPHYANPGHSAPVTAVCAFPEHDLVCSGSRDDTLSVWRLSTGRQLKRFGMVQLLIGAIAPLTSSEFVTGSALGRIQVWPFELHEIPFTPIRFTDGAANTSGVVYAPSLERMFTPSYYESDIRVWDTSTGEPLPGLQGHEEGVYGIAQSHGGRFLVTASEDTTLRIWETETGRCRHVLRGHGCGVRGVAVSPDDRLIVSGGDDGSLIVWDFEHGTLLGRLDGDGASIPSLSINPDGSHIVTGDLQSRLRLWTLDTTPEPQAMALLDGPINCVQALQGKVIAGSVSGSLYCLEYS